MASMTSILASTLATPPGRFLAYVVIYIALEWLSDLRAPGGMPITAWSPGLGVLFAAMIRGDIAAPVALLFAPSSPSISSPRPTWARWRP